MPKVASARAKQLASFSISMGKPRAFSKSSFKGLSIKQTVLLFLSIPVE
jgi:hypothetical protein